MTNYYFYLSENSVFEENVHISNVCVTFKKSYSAQLFIFICLR